MKVSVIIPIGNREVYAECKESFLHSIEKCEANSCKWELVEVFDDEHKGVSWARNEGLKKASGEYVAWIDADDEVTSDWASVICDGLESCPDVLSFNARVVWRDSLRIGYYIGGEANAADVMSERTNSQLWNKVIRRGLFNGLEFKGVVHEDYRLLCELLPMAKTFKHISKTLYTYRRTRKGASQFPNAESARKALNGLIEMCENLQANYKQDMQKGVTQRIADFCINSMGDWNLRKFILKYFFGLVIDSGISTMVKVKCLLAAMGCSWRRCCV